jgi:hypothetical protein
MKSASNNNKISTLEIWFPTICLLYAIGEVLVLHRECLRTGIIELISAGLVYLVLYAIVPASLRANVFYIVLLGLGELQVIESEISADEFCKKLPGFVDCGALFIVMSVYFIAAWYYPIVPRILLSFDIGLFAFLMLVSVVTTSVILPFKSAGIDVSKLRSILSGK